MQARHVDAQRMANARPPIIGVAAAAGRGIFRAAD